MGKGYFLNFLLVLCVVHCICNFIIYINGAWLFGALGWTGALITKLGYDRLLKEVYLFFDNHKKFRTELNKIISEAKEKHKKDC